MNRIFVAVVFFAALGVVGCASAPFLVGAPGQERLAVPMTARAATAGDPSLCIASLTKPNYFAHLTGGFGVAFRSLKLLTQEHPNPAGCDLILALITPGASIFSVHEVKAYSGYTGELAWRGSSSGVAGTALGMHVALAALGQDFSLGEPLRRKLDEEAVSGRRITVEDLRRLGLVMPSEAAMSASLSTEVRLARAKAAASPAPHLSAPAPLSPRPVAAAPVAVAVRSDLDALPAARPTSSKRHAIVIGVERYREKLPAADFAAGDAKLAAEYYKRVLGVPEENLALLTDDRATKSDFEKYFERWLPNRVEKDDEVFVYFSGHGAPNPAKGDAYLVPYDGDPTYIEQTGYPLKKMFEQLSKLPAKRVLVAMDSCFSGAGGRSVIAKGARPLVATIAADVPANLTVVSASAGDQISNSYQEKGHGLFTYYFLKGLKEKGGDFKAAFDYLKPEVARTARREYNADQDPQWRGAK